MDLNTTTLFSKGVTEGIVAGFLYDVFSLVIAFIIVKFFYEKIYMTWKWGRWRIRVQKLNRDGNLEEVAQRKISVHSAKRILEDDGEFSVYVKGIVSPHMWLNLDIASQKAKDISLTNIDKGKREILIDLSKNPIKKKPIKFTKNTQEQIDKILEIIQSSNKNNNLD